MNDDLDDNELTESEIAIINLTRRHDYSAGPLKIQVGQTSEYRILSSNDGLENPSELAGRKFNLYEVTPIRRPPELKSIEGGRPPQDVPPPPPAAA